MSWAEQLLRELKFYFLKRGVLLKSVEQLLSASFSAELVSTVEKATLGKIGWVVNKRQQLM